MITNSLEKYTSLFADASEVLNSNNTPTQIQSFQEYYEVLKILAKQNPIFLRVPIDEELFEINLNTRKISVPQIFEENGVGVKGDDLAEAIYFKVDRYFDAQDLADTDIFIEWQVGKTKGISKAFCIDVETFEDKIVFGWAITAAITEGGANTLIFSPRFIVQKTNLDNEQEITYSLGTLPQKIKINDSLNLIKDEGIVVDQSDTSKIIDSIIGGDGILDIYWSRDILTQSISFVTDAYQISVEAVTPSHFVTYQWYRRDLDTKIIEKIDDEFTYICSYNFNHPYFILVEPGEEFSRKRLYFTRDEDGKYTNVKIRKFEEGVTYYTTNVGPIDPNDPETATNTGLINDYLYRLYDRNALYYRKKEGSNEYEAIDNIEDYFPEDTEKGFFTQIIKQEDIDALTQGYDGKVYREASTCTITKPGQYYVTATSAFGQYEKTIQSGILTVLKPVSEIEQVKDLRVYDGCIGTVGDDDVYYQYDETGEKLLIEVQHKDIKATKTLKAIEEIKSSADGGIISYQWQHEVAKDSFVIEDGERTSSVIYEWEDIEEATANEFVVSEAGNYRVKIINTVNGASQADPSPYYARITNLPAIPQENAEKIDKTEKILSEENTKFELKVYVLDEDESDGRYFAWYRQAEYSADERMWPDEGSLPIITNSKILESSLIVSTPGIYYCLVYNYLNGIISSPTKIGDFTITEEA